MNTESLRIQKLLKRNWEGPMWHGTHLKAVLDGISWEKAFQKPSVKAHNIYELVNHMYCWRKFVLENLKGNTSYTVAINSALDWVKDYEKIEAVWKEALDELEKNQKALVSAAKKLTDEQLEELVPGKKFNWYVLIHGCVHHDIYHSAQISLLKK
jgi:uncharacterized damage-inducible protein DinB